MQLAASSQSLLMTSHGHHNSVSIAQVASAEDATQWGPLSKDGSTLWPMVSDIWQSWPLCWEENDCEKEVLLIIFSKFRTEYVQGMGRVLGRRILLPHERFEEKGVLIGQTIIHKKWMASLSWIGKWILDNERERVTSRTHDEIDIIADRFAPAISTHAERNPLFKTLLV